MGGGDGGSAGVDSLSARLNPDLSKLAASVEKKRKDREEMAGVQPSAQKARSPAPRHQQEKKEEDQAPPPAASAEAVAPAAPAKEDSEVPLPLRFLEDVFGLNFSTMEKEVMEEKARNQSVS